MIGYCVACLDVYVYMHTYFMKMYKYTRTYMCIVYIIINNYIQVNMRAQMTIHMHQHIRMNVHIHINTHVPIHILTHIPAVHIHVRIRLHMGA